MLLCGTIGVQRSSFYHWKKCLTSLAPKIKALADSILLFQEYKQNRIYLYIKHLSGIASISREGIYMENSNQKLDLAFNFALDTQGEADSRWRVIVKYYGDLDIILNGIQGVAYTGLFNNYAIVSVPASELGTLADTQGIIYVEKPREVYYNVNNGRAASCINSVQEGPGITSGAAGLKGNGVLVAIIDSGERVIILLSQQKPGKY